MLLITDNLLVFYLLTYFRKCLCSLNQRTKVSLWNDGRFAHHQVQLTSCRNKAIITTVVVVISVSVCLFACMSVPWHSSKTTRQNFTKISIRGLVVFWRQYAVLCTSGFVDDVMFYITEGINRIKKSRMFRPFRQMAAPVGRQTMLFGGDRR